MAVQVRNGDNLHSGGVDCDTPSGTGGAERAAFSATITPFGGALMPFVITDPCIGTKDTACVDVCPVDCIHPRKDEPEFDAMTMLYIHPEECIDCGACVPACPVAAIYDSHDSTPASQKALIPANDIYRNGDADAMAKAEEIVKAHVAANPELMAIDSKDRQAAHG